jgi:hypothetical protein
MENLIDMHEIKGPIWEDGCNHPPGSYVASFQTFLGLDVKERIDLYAYPLPDGKMNFCMRFGPEGHEYYSPGDIENIIKSANHEPYHIALFFLKYFGKITWVRN